MKINNRLIQYATGIFFLLAYLLVWFTPMSHQSDNHKPSSRIKVNAATSNQSATRGHQVRKISLEIILFSNKY